MPANTHRDPVETLEEAGPLLYGLEWRVPLAAALGVTVRTLDNWRAHKTSPSPELPLSLQAVYRSRAPEKRREMGRDLEKLRKMFGEAGDTEAD